MNSSTTFQTVTTAIEKVSDIGDDNGFSWFSLGLGLMLAITGISGNALVCLAVRVQRKLQNVTNYFLVSLAVTDLLVSLVVIPCCVVQEFIGHWTLGFVVCDVWQVIDVMLCTSSIWHMCTISIDRYIGIRNPLRVGTGYRSPRAVGVKIAVIYLLSFAIASPLILIGILQPDLILIPLEDDNTSGTNLTRSTAASRDRYRCAVANNHFLVYGSLVAFFVPLAIMLVAVTLSVRLLADSNGRRSRWFAAPAVSHGSSSLASTTTTTTTTTMTSPASIPVDDRRPSGQAASHQPTASTSDQLVNDRSRLTPSDTCESKALILTSRGQDVDEDGECLGQRSDGAISRFTKEWKYGQTDSIAVSNVLHDESTSSTGLLDRDGGAEKRKYADAMVNGGGDCAQPLPYDVGFTRSDGTVPLSNLQVEPCRPSGDSCVSVARRKILPITDAGEVSCKGLRSNSYVTACTEFLLDLTSTFSPSTSMVSALSTGKKVDPKAHANRRKSMGDQARISDASAGHECALKSRVAEWMLGDEKKERREMSRTGRGAKLLSGINECCTVIGSDPLKNDNVQILDCRHLLPTSRVRSCKADEDCPRSPTSDCTSYRRLNGRRSFSPFDYTSLSMTVIPPPIDTRMPHLQFPTSKSVARSCFQFPRLGIESRGSVSRQLNNCVNDDAVPDTNFITGSSATSRFRALIRRHRNSIRAVAAAATPLSCRRAGNANSVKHKSSTSAVDTTGGGCYTSSSVRSERKAARVLGTVFAVFVVCWTPFFAVNMAIGIGLGGTSGSDVDEASKMVGSSMMTVLPHSTAAVVGLQESRATDGDSSSSKGSDRLLTVCQWLGYVSSTLNPIIYTAFNRTFRRTFVDIIARCRCTAAAYRAKEQRRSATATAVGCARRLISATARLDVQQDISATVMTSQEAE